AAVAAQRWRLHPLGEQLPGLVSGHRRHGHAGYRRCAAVQVNVISGAPRRPASTSMPRPGPSGALPLPPSDRGTCPATCSATASLTKHTLSSPAAGVAAARWLIAAVATSPPQVSSIVTRAPRASARSRIVRVALSPPSLPSLRLTAPAPPSWITA